MVIDQPLSSHADVAQATRLGSPFGATPCGDLPSFYVREADPEPSGRLAGTEVAPMAVASFDPACSCWDEPAGAINPICPVDPTRHVPASYRPGFGRPDPLAKYRDRHMAHPQEAGMDPAFDLALSTVAPVTGIHPVDKVQRDVLQSGPVFVSAPVNAAQRDVLPNATHTETHVRHGIVARLLIRFGFLADDATSARLDAVDQELDSLDAAYQRLLATRPTMPAGDVQRRLDSVTQEGFIARQQA